MSDGRSSVGLGEGAASVSVGLEEAEASAPSEEAEASAAFGGADLGGSDGPDACETSLGFSGADLGGSAAPADFGGTEPFEAEAEAACRDLAAISFHLWQSALALADTFSFECLPT